MSLENLNKDELILIALELDTPSLLKLCQSNKRFNNIVCNNQNMWRNKLIKDFPVYYEENIHHRQEQNYKIAYMNAYLREYRIIKGFYTYFVNRFIGRSISKYLKESYESEFVDGLYTVIHNYNIIVAEEAEDRDIPIENVKSGYIIDAMYEEIQTSMDEVFTDIIPLNEQLSAISDFVISLYRNPFGMFLGQLEKTNEEGTQYRNYPRIPTLA